MLDFKAIRTGAGLSALMTAMIGCDSGERIQATPAASRPDIGAVSLEDSSEFDRELIRTKAGHADPALQVKAIQELFDRYGVAYPRAAAPDAPIVVETAAFPESSGAAAKEAAAQNISWTAVRRQFSANVNDIVTFRNVADVRRGESVASAALAGSANVDPVLVAFYAETLGPERFRLKVAAFNDDAGSANRNSVISWTNNTEIDQFVYIVAFAYSTSSRGLGNVVVNTTRTSNFFTNQPIGGLKQWGAAPLPQVPNRCVFSKTRITYEQLTGTGRNFGTALVVDNKAMRGAYIWDTPASIDLSWQVDNPYPSFALLFGDPLPSRQTGAIVQVTQRDIYSCVQ